MALSADPTTQAAAPLAWPPPAASGTLCWKILVGAVVLARANQDPAAASRLDRMMEEALTEDRDRSLLEEWRSSSRSSA